VRRWQLDAISQNVLASGGPKLQKLAVAGDRVLAVDTAGTLASWTLGDDVRRAIGHVDGRVSDLLLAPDGSVVTGTVEGDLAWWPDAANTPPTHRKLTGILKGIAATRDRIAVATSAGPISLESPKSTRGSLPGHEGGSDVVAFTPDGMLLASGGQDRAIRVWHREKGASVATDKLVAAGALDGPRGDTHFITFTPKGDRLIAAGNDGAVFQWNVRDGAVDASSRKVLAQHTGAITALAVTDGYVVSAGRDLEVVRIPTTGAPDKATLAAAAITLVVEDSGTIDAVTRTGAVVRWPVAGAPSTEIDHGVVAGERVPGTPQWVLAFDDGALVIASLRDAPLADLRTEIAKLTTFRLH
jgi:WD40 repeat protein